LEQLDVIATSFEPTSVEYVRTRLAAVLGSFSDGGVVTTSTRLGARIAGEPFDQHRLDMLEQLIEIIDDHAPRPVPLLGNESRWEWEPFFEAYFSNFIEGTEFGIDEARSIVIDKIVPAARPADAHDIAATFNLSADTFDRKRVPTTDDELVEILSHRHSFLMAARPEKRPGRFKVQRNFAGGYQFVEPELVEGTLRRGFNIMQALRDPLGRAIAMMALVTECHPFDDGNGRVARLTANAELSAAGQVRIVIPTVFRNNYLAALTGFSRGAGRGESLISVLEYAQRWTAGVDWRTFDRAIVVLEGVNAFMDSGVADASGVRLEMPSKLRGR
jgi:Fic family protein